jgi:alginate O-acetyltransferase complex protein AlgI
MVFTSQIFLWWFLPAVLLPYLLLVAGQRRAAGNRRRWLVAQNAWLLAASYVFYAWAEPRLLVVLLAVTLGCYAGGVAIAGSPPGSVRRRGSLGCAVVAVLGTLVFFKYFNFFAVNVGVVSQALGGPAIFSGWSVTLPLGISFFTFQGLSYCIDVARGHAPRARSLVDFACYLAMFPQLVAGPIVRYATVAGQLVERRVCADRFGAGTALFMLGVAKKVLLANPLGEVADAAFGAGQLGWVAAWWGAAAYTLQLYFDFSGYSDMAVGLGRMFGFEFLKNFASPYRAVSITEFWRRWHISLSTFLRDYLYHPLGGNRRGSTRTLVNLGVVMLLGGFWHGANWTFLVWGAWHALWLIAERLRGKASLLGNVPAPLRAGFTLVIVMLGWVVFRAPSLTEAAGYLRAMAGGGGETGLLAPLLFGGGKGIVLAIAAGLAIQRREAHDWCEQLTTGRALAVLAIFGLAMVAMAAQAFNPFLYFQF